MNFIKFFYNQNKFVVFCFFISLTTYLSYEFTMDLKEWFYGADSLYSLISQLSLAYMGGFIFYTIQTGYADYKARKVQLKLLIPKLNNIIATIEQHLNTLFKSCLNIEYQQINNNKKSFEELYNLMDLEDLLQVFDNNGNQKSVKFEQITHKNSIEKNIYDIYTLLGNDIEKDIQKLLNEILESDYFKSIEHIENNKLGNQTIESTKPYHLKKSVVATAHFKVVSTNYEDLYSYYISVVKLNAYVNKRITS